MIPRITIIVMMTVVINIPICLASLYAFHEEYRQNGWESKLMSNPRHGNLREIASYQTIVKNGRENCVIICQIFFCFMMNDRSKIIIFSEIVS